MIEDSPNSPLAPGLLKRLRCPVDLSPLRVATAGEVNEINRKIQSAQLRDHLDAVVSDSIDSALVSAAGRYYPIRDGLPTIIADESFLLAEN